MTPRALLGLLALSVSFATAQSTDRPLMVRPPQIQTEQPTQALPLQNVLPSTPDVAAAGRVMPAPAPASAVSIPKRSVSSGVGHSIRIQGVKSGLIWPGLGQQSSGVMVRPRASVSLRPLSLPSGW